MAHGAGPGPREACPVGGGSSGFRSSAMAPRLPPPRVRAPFLCGSPFPPAPRDRPNWFLRSRVVPLVSYWQPQLGLGAGPAVGPPSVPPLGGEELDGEPRHGQTRPRSSPVPSCAPAAGGHPGRAPSASPASPGPLSGPRTLPPPWGRDCHPAPPAPRHFAATLGQPDRHLRSVTAPARKAGEAAARPGPELPR